MNVSNGNIEDSKAEKAREAAEMKIQRDTTRQVVREQLALGKAERAAV